MRMTGVMSFLTVTLLAGAAMVVSAGEREPLETVPEVDLDRYQGKWYEIARLPNFFQRKCLGNVTAEYTRRDDGSIGVRNACEVEGGKVDSVEGVARVAEPGHGNARLEVSFLPGALRWIPFTWGDYWVIALDPGYQYAVVGAPGRKYLWILARDPRMDEDTYRRLIDVAASQGFDTAAVTRTDQATP